MKLVNEIDKFLTVQFLILPGNCLLKDIHKITIQQRLGVIAPLPHSFIIRITVCLEIVKESIMTTFIIRVIVCLGVTKESIITIICIDMNLMFTINTTMPFIASIK
ncbi:hypothetical protein PoB_005253100 [Plakobranchus ocellatus]|uniref:Uncharacterized protein n=1 Tax=Plakobranchus ocellatus TaxID=259542 RepID=A0AAV4C3Q2_9GAST|nr:hypothetical protein PoB_005253100 [Plakobranchus ocellatus]